MTRASARPWTEPRGVWIVAGHAIICGHGQTSDLQTCPQGRPRLPGGRLVLHFPRLSRAAAPEPQVGRAAGECRARLLQHAVEADARHETGGTPDTPCRRVRQIREDVPQRTLFRL